MRSSLFNSSSSMLIAVGAVVAAPLLSKSRGWTTRSTVYTRWKLLLVVHVMICRCSIDHVSHGSLLLACPVCSFVLTEHDTAEGMPM